MLEKDYTGFSFYAGEHLIQHKHVFSSLSDQWDVSHKSNLNDCILHSAVKQGHNMVGTTAINYEGEFEM